jgi:hypothetical protein
VPAPRRADQVLSGEGLAGVFASPGRAGSQDLRVGTHNRQLRVHPRGLPTTAKGGRSRPARHHTSSCRRLNRAHVPSWRKRCLPPRCPDSKRAVGSSSPRLVLSGVGDSCRNQEDQRFVLGPRRGAKTWTETPRHKAIGDSRAKGLFLPGVIPHLIYICLAKGETSWLRAGLSSTERESP